MFQKAVDIRPAKLHLLPYSKIFVDHGSRFSAEEVAEHSEWFHPVNAKFLNFGYIFHNTVWVRFTLENGGNRPIRRRLVFTNPYTDIVNLYRLKDKKIVEEEKSGIFNLKHFDGPLRLSFVIDLSPGEKSEYLLQLVPKTGSLLFELLIEDEAVFYMEELKHQAILFLFFGILFAVIVYNSVIYYVSREKIYLYYTFYVFSLALHHLSLSGVSSYLLPFPSSFVVTEAYFSVYYFILVAIATVLFTREFLQTRHYPIVDKMLLASLIPPLLVALFSTRDHYLLNVIVYYGAFMTFLLEGVGIYSWRKGEPKAGYYLVAWTVSLSGILLLILYHTGIIHFYIPYYFEGTIIFEVLFFAVVIAWEYNRVKDEKLRLMNQLSKTQERQVEELNRLVGERTHALENSLKNYRMLLKELNHRVKNNLQMIVSLLHLQGDESNTASKEEILRDMESRILAISEVYEMLYREENFSSVDAKKYIEKLAHHIRLLYPEGEHVSLDIESDAMLPMNQAVYCGIVLAELMTNTLKHAVFPKSGGQITISLKQIEKEYHLQFGDNGTDVDLSSDREGLGMMIVETIVCSQLKGKIEWESRPMQGVQFAISFPLHEDGNLSR